MVSIIFIRETDVFDWTSVPFLPRNRLRAFLSQMALKDNGVSRVAFIDGVCNVANEGNQSDKEVNNDIDDHFHAKAGRETPIDVFAVVHHHHCQPTICGIADTESISCQSGGRRVC